MPESGTNRITVGNIDWFLATRTLAELSRKEGRSLSFGKQIKRKEDIRLVTELGGTRDSIEDAAVLVS